MARSYSGETREGYTKAASEADLLNWLREQGCTALNVEVVSSGAVKKTGSLVKRISAAQLAAAFWQLTTMVEGGITVADALEGIAEDMENAKLQKILQKMLTHVERGGMVSDSMAKFPGVFNQLVISLVMAGETGGNLAAAFQRVAEFYTNRDRLARKIKKAVAYPAFVLGFVVLVVIVIMTLIIPRFQEMFKSFGSGNLPAFTRSFMAVYNVVAGNWYYIIGGLVFLIVMFYLWFTRVGVFHSLCSRLFMRVPLFGKLLKYAFIASFCKTMSNLLRGGVSVQETFDILIDMTRNELIRSHLIAVKEGVVGGSSIYLSMLATKFFPNMVVKMVRAGEESGSLWKTLDRTADYYEEKVDATISTITSLLEPIMIIMVGGIVLVVVLALYLPIFQISDLRSQ